jgi:hypothetical protein
MMPNDFVDIVYNTLREVLFAAEAARGLNPPAVCV